MIQIREHCVGCLFDPWMNCTQSDEAMKMCDFRIGNNDEENTC